MSVDSNIEILAILLENLQERVGKAASKIWFEDLQLISLEKSRAILQTSVKYKRDMLNSRYLTVVSEVLSDLFGEKVEPVFILEEERFRYVTDEAELVEDPEVDSYDFSQAEYNFDNFIVGKSNQFAANAAKSIAESPGKRYNPLLIYGGSGLGKTHLLYAVKNEILRRHPSWIIRDFTSENFINDLALAIRYHTQEEFREKYRKVDVLLMDDIQFLGRTDFAQDEFFFTFNELYQQGKQIFLTSDRPPKEIALLVDRIKTRLEGGNLVALNPPEYETRMAIVTAKAQFIGLQLPNDVISYIAQTITYSIRQLEGSVKKLMAYRDLFGNITLENAYRAIDDLIQTDPGISPTPNYIIQKVSEFYSIEEKAILGNSQQADVSLARHVSMYLIRNLTDMSLQRIGRELFKKDHTTVLSALRKIDKRKEEDEIFVADLDHIITNIRG
jgi:chromosomal replication initiator protein